MVNINAQEWLDEKYPINKTCQRDSNKENKGKKREEITKLDISKEKVGNNYFNDGKILIGSLKLEGFTNLRTFICSSHQIVNLDVSVCTNLEVLECQDNQLTNLNVDGCHYLNKINCSNSNVRELDLSTCINLNEVNISGCSTLTKVKSSLVYDAEERKLVRNSAKNVSQVRKAENNETRNVLIVGITGNGKSALANTLSNTILFEEKDTTTSVTKNFQKSEVFQWEGKNYHVIDNIGFGDTNRISTDDILFKIGEGIHSAKEGINQILFVFKGRFSPEQMNAFNMFKDFIAETGITKFTTLIRTNFPSFRNPEKCQEDNDALLNENKELVRIINSCNGIIYVDNPPIPVIEDEDSESERENKEKRVNINDKKRKKSRERILNHLAENCPEIYKLKEWDSIVSMVNNYNKKKEQIEQSNSLNKEEELKEAKTQVAKQINKGIEASVGINVPGIPVSFNAAIKYSTQTTTICNSQPLNINTQDMDLDTAHHFDSLVGSTSDNKTGKELAKRAKRQLSISSQTETLRQEIKMPKMTVELETQSEPMEIDSSEQINQIEIPPKSSK